MFKFRYFPHHFRRNPKNYSFITTINKSSHVNLHIHANLFDEISQRDISFLNCVLNQYIRNGDAFSTWNIFHQMHSNCTELNSYTFTPVLRACSALLNPTRGLQVHALMIKLGLDSEIITKTALIDMYSRCGELEKSFCLFDEMSYRDVVAWNAMLSIYLHHALPLKAIDLFYKMRRERIEFSEFTLCSVLKACTLLRAYQQGKQIHGLILVMGRDLVVLCTALIDFYSKIEQIDEAMKIYHTLSWKKDDIIYNSLISGCVRNKRYDVAMSLLNEIRPNVIALTSALAACSENSDMWIGKQIHAMVIRQDFTSDTQLCNALLDMYSKCGKIQAAGLVFEGICKKDVVSWTSMIDAYGSHGYGVEALELFNRMGEKENKVLPNAVTFLAILSACGHSGLVEQGRECFFMVPDRYGLEPGPEHYASLIDILGRAGHIKDVWSLFHHMVEKGTKPSTAVWSALLNACRINQDVIRGEFAAKQLLELEPNNPGNYVALSNFYAAAGRWDVVDELRTIMKKKGIAKGEGSSWVTVARLNAKLESDESGTLSLRN